MLYNQKLVRRDSMNYTINLHNKREPHKGMNSGLSFLKEQGDGVLGL